MTRSASVGSAMTRSHAVPPCPAAKKEHVELEVRPMLGLQGQLASFCMNLHFRPCAVQLYAHGFLYSCTLMFCCVAARSF